MAVDIIMATHNHLGMTIRAVEALFAYTKVPFNLTFIDDSTDLTPTYIHQLHAEHDNINLVRPKDDFSRSNRLLNIGFENTASPIVIFMSNSTVVEPEWIEVPLLMMQDMKDVAIIGNKNLFPNGTIENAGMYFHKPMIHHMNYGVGDSAHRWTHLREVDAVGFCLVFLRRECVYPFEEGFYNAFYGFEDVDTCFQVRKKGYKVYYCGYSTAYHYACTTRGAPETWSEETQRKYEENRHIFTERWSN